MQVGVADGTQLAIAVLGVSEPLSADTLDSIKRVAAVDKVMQIGF